MSKMYDLRVKAGLTQAALAEKVGASQGQIDKLEKSKRKMTREWAERLAPALNTRPIDLLFADVPLVRSFDPDREDPIEPEDGPLLPPDAIRELAASAGLGAGQVIETTFRREGKEHVAQDALTDDYWRVPPQFIRDRLHARVTDLLVVHGEGDSMIPTIHPLDAVIVNTAHKIPSPDGLYAIRDRFDHIIVKRLHLGATDTIHVISDNPVHPPVERALDEIAIVGRVLMVLKIV